MGYVPLSDVGTWGKGWNMSEGEVYGWGGGGGIGGLL